MDLNKYASTYTFMITLLDGKPILTEFLIVGTSVSTKSTIVDRHFPYTEKHSLLRGDI